MQLFQVDLDGDGSNEILIVAQNIIPGKNTIASWEPDTPLTVGPGLPIQMEKGQYSLVLLRKIIKGKTHEIPLKQYIALSNATPLETTWKPPSLYKIFQFADLNGDGTLEIILGDDYYQDFSYSIFKIRQNKATEVLQLEN